MARVEVVAQLSSDDTHAVLDLLRVVSAEDGVSPLSEHVMLHLRHGGEEPGRHLLIRDGDLVVGYAHLDTTDAVLGSSAELAVSPGRRGHGHATELVQSLLEQSPDGRLRLWAHGTHPGAAALARRMGFTRERVLWQMRRSLLAALPAAAWPAGVSVRTFLPGQDEEAWLRVNNRAFADHPDQGTWTLADLQVREREPWFDPAGFFLAEADGELVGYHWTKVHGGHPEHPHPHEHAHELRHEGHGHDHDPIGEVYVVGVDPAAQGIGLGPALTLAGLSHLRSLRLPQAMLYVDEANTNAISVYSKLGFSRWDTDVCFAR